MTRTAAIVAVLVGCAARAAAQETVEPRVTAEAVASASMLSSNQHVAGMLDVTGTLRVADGATVIVRPWMWQRPDGTFTFQMYQFQLRYELRTRTPVRVDAGVITSPIGLNPLQMRADLNPTISTIPYYVIPLPPFEPRFEGLLPVSAGYPLGVVISTSGTRWDARGGVLDTTPARAGVELKHDGRPAMPQIVVGGGVTPRAGFRIGGGLARGGYREDSATIGPGEATVANVESEFTVNHTRLSGEWVVDRFRGATGLVTARAFYLQAVQTITPRLFAATRVTRVMTPPVFPSGLETEWTSAELTAGFRLSTQFTARAGYVGQRPYSTQGRAAAWSHAAAVSIVWNSRWFH